MDRGYDELIERFVKREPRGGYNVPRDLGDLTDDQITTIVRGNPDILAEVYYHAWLDVDQRLRDNDVRQDALYGHPA